MCTKDKKCVLNSCITLMWTIMIFFWHYMKSKTNEQWLLYLTADAEQGVCRIRKILMGQKAQNEELFFEGNKFERKYFADGFSYVLQ